LEFKNFELKKIFSIVIASIFLIGCDNQIKDAMLFSANSKIDSLIKESKNTNYNANTRLDFANMALEIINKKEIDSILTDQTIELAASFFDLNFKNKYLEINKDLYEKGLANNDYYAIENGSYCLASYFYNKTVYDSAYYFFTKCEKACIKNKNNFLLGHVKGVKANIHSYKKDFTQAEKLAIESLKSAKEEKKPRFIYNCYLTLGSTSLGLNNYEQAIHYNQEALKITPQLTNEPDYSYIKASPYNYIALIHIKQNEFKKAIKLIQEALQFDDYKKTDPIIYCYLKQNLAYAKYKLGDKTQWKEFETLLKIGDSIDNIPIQMVNNAHLAEYYFDQKEFDKAKMHALAAKQMGHQTQFFDDELAALDLLAKIEPQNAKVYLERRIELADSLQTVERLSRDKFARIEYETDELATQKNEVEAKNQLIVRRFWIVFGFSTLLLLVFFLWFKMHKQSIKNKELLLIQENQKANQEVYQLMLDQQQQIEKGKRLEKQRISMELHDGVMGRLTAVRMNLFPLIMTENSEKTDQYLAQLDGIQAVEKEIRAISHELNSNVFNENSNFVSVINQLIQEIEHHARLHFDVKISNNIPWDIMDTSLKINLYRILQEALQNIEKYAEAKKVTITMFYKENQLNLEITDDGKGFDTSIKHTGIGLKNMQNRVNLLHGQFSIDSKPGKGVKIILLIPI
jgi:signal transduction histidine kinase